MSNDRYKRRGWFGDSNGHSLAARGIKLYAKKNDPLVDPLFFAKREDLVSSQEMRDMALQEMTFEQMMQMHPSADKDDMRKRAIKAIESIYGNPTLSKIDKHGVDDIVKEAKHNDRFRRSVRSVLKDPVKASFIKEDKRQALLNRTRAGKDEGSSVGLVDPAYFEGEVPY